MTLLDRFQLLAAARTFERLALADARRRAAALAHLNRQRRTWYADSSNVRTLINAKLESIWIPREARHIVSAITTKPWLYRSEFVAARCRELDTKVLKCSPISKSLNG